MKYGNKTISFFSSECDKKILNKELMCSHLGINLALFLENFLYICNSTVLISVTEVFQFEVFVLCFPTFAYRFLSVPP